jgi:hypothetical protein
MRPSCSTCPRNCARRLICPLSVNPASVLWRDPNTIRAINPQNYIGYGLNPNFHGIGINVKEAVRRFQRWLKEIVKL